MLRQQWPTGSGPATFGGPFLKLAVEMENQVDDLPRLDGGPKGAVAIDTSLLEGDKDNQSEVVLTQLLLGGPGSLNDAPDVEAERRDGCLLLERSDASVSSLSAISNSSTTSRKSSSVVSSIELALSSSHSSKHDDNSVGSESDHELDASISSCNSEYAPREASAGGINSLSSLSSLSSFSSTSSNRTQQSAYPTRPNLQIDNLPCPIVPDPRSNHAPNGADYSEWITNWEIDQYVTPEVLSSLTSSEPVELHIEGSGGDGSEDQGVLVDDNVRSCLDDSAKATMLQDVVDQDDYIGFDELRTIFQEYVPYRDEAILDVGCGASRVCRELVFCGYNNVYGIDKSAQMITYQQQQAEELREFVQFLEMNVAALGFPDSFFDCIFWKATLDRIAYSAGNSREEHLLHALQEITRCLRPGALWISVSGANVDILDEEKVASDSSVVWWEWEQVQQFLAGNYAAVEKYECGTPFVLRGKIVKPFVIRVLRRVELQRQRDVRWANTIIKRKQLQKEIEIRSKWRSVHTCQHLELEVRERELPLMVYEDVMSKQCSNQSSYKQSRIDREKLRQQIYSNIMEDERMNMIQEDELGVFIRTCALETQRYVHYLVALWVESVLMVLPATEKVEKTTAITKSIGSIADAEMHSMMAADHPAKDVITDMLASIVDSVVLTKPDQAAMGTTNEIETGNERSGGLELDSAVSDGDCDIPGSDGELAGFQSRKFASDGAGAESEVQSTLLSGNTAIKATAFNAVSDVLKSIIDDTLLGFSLTDSTISRLNDANTNHQASESDVLKEIDFDSVEQDGDSALPDERQQLLSDLCGDSTLPATEVEESTTEPNSSIQSPCLEAKFIRNDALPLGRGIAVSFETLVPPVLSSTNDCYQHVLKCIEAIIESAMINLGENSILEAQPNESMPLATDERSIHVAGDCPPISPSKSCVTAEQSTRQTPKPFQNGITGNAEDSPNILQACQDAMEALLLRVCGDSNTFAPHRITST